MIEEEKLIKKFQGIQAYIRHLAKEEHDRKEIEHLKEFAKYILSTPLEERQKEFRKRMRGEQKMWMFDDDITWCASDCDNTVCFRHPSNRQKTTDGPDIYTAGYLKDTEYCPLWKGEEK